jgi:hypothetical protein
MRTDLHVHRWTLSGLLTLILAKTLENIHTYGEHLENVTFNALLSRILKECLADEQSSAVFSVLLSSAPEKGGRECRQEIWSSNIAYYKFLMTMSLSIAT